MAVMQKMGPVEVEKSGGDKDRKSDQESARNSKQAADDERSDMEEGGPGDGNSSKDAGPILRTYEIFGRHRGRVVPLSEVLQIRAGTKQLTRGAQVFVTDQASQGFGLGGEPGLWEDLYPGVDPAAYGLDADKPVLASDGACGWVLDAHYLAMLFGAAWRRVVYGN